MIESPHIVFFFGKCGRIVHSVVARATHFVSPYHYLLHRRPPIPISLTMPLSRHDGAGSLRVPRRRVAPSPCPHPAKQNLRDYLSGASLPSISRNDSSHPYYLPLRGRRSHKNRLRVKKDPQRHINDIRRHDPKAFNDAVKYCQ